ncbi:MAG: cell division ATP-binding protein FtsE [Chromatiales bacterium]|nr:cell division ATP-binding protein FtsE [Chromatiales bacterium]
MIHFEGVSKRYPGPHDALVDIDLHVDPGEMCFLTGHSGAGKSTLLKLLALIERPTRGQLHVNGRHLNRTPYRRIADHRRQLGIVFQDHHLLFDRTVFDNVALPLVVRGIAHRDILKRTHAALDKVGLLSHRERFPIELSGGEQQRVGIARAIVHRPALVLADEPTGNLDPELSAEIMRLFELFNHVGVTVLIATHDLALVERMGHRRLTLRGGRLVGDSG